MVKLDVWRDGNKGASELDLSRDLRMGITEYAPGSKLIADKNIWESTGLRILPGKALISHCYTECNKCGSFRTRIDTGSHNENTEPCENCGTELTTDKKFVVPQFGFVGRRSNDQPGEVQPPKAGRSQFYFSDYAGEHSPITEEVSVSRSKVHVRFSRQGRITVINAGPAERGFRVCLSCGHTEPTIDQHKSKAKKTAPHFRPGTHRECNGFLSVRHLGHDYLTDVVELDLMAQMDHIQAQSTLYALLAATPALGIPTEDVDGMLGPTRSYQHRPLIIFDRVPGGAGHVKCIRQNLERLLKAAYSIVSKCTCASSTSCYGCIRTYRNQYLHELLTRGEAKKVLGDILSV